MNFLEAIFSFVFGDGNPNESYEDRRWRLVRWQLALLPAVDHPVLLPKLCCRLHSAQAGALLSL